LVNLSSSHQNILFTSDKAYLLNGVAYDFYSIGELENRSEPHPQWKTFPLPNEHLPANITPWMPSHHERNETKSINMPVLSETTTGLAFVDHIYIVTTPTLTDRHISIKKVLAQYQITNYELRMKWTFATCRALDNREEINRKLNLDINHSIGKTRFILLSLSFNQLCRI
jgi:hypothetical protein